jgi:hypothetical protein
MAFCENSIIKSLLPLNEHYWGKTLSCSLLALQITNNGVICHKSKWMRLHVSFFIINEEEEIFVGNFAKKD